MAGKMLYQSGVQRIEVVVRKEGGGGYAGAKETSAENATGKQRTWRTVLTGSEDPQRVKRVFKTNITHTLAAARQVVDLAASYAHSGIGLTNGDQAYQQQVQRKVEVFKDVTGFASSVAMGALYGSWGGPLGTFVGATLGAITTGASTGFKYLGRQREYDYKVFKEENAIEYQRARANINLTNGRLR